MHVIGFITLEALTTTTIILPETKKIFLEQFALNTDELILLSNQHSSERARIEAWLQEEGIPHPVAFRDPVHIKEGDYTWKPILYLEILGIAQTMTEKNPDFMFFIDTDLASRLAIDEVAKSNPFPTLISPSLAEAVPLFQDLMRRFTVDSN